MINKNSPTLKILFRCKKTSPNEPFLNLFGPLLPEEVFSKLICQRLLSVHKTDHVAKIPKGGDEHAREEMPLEGINDWSLVQARHRGRNSRSFHLFIVKQEICYGIKINK